MKRWFKNRPWIWIVLFFITFMVAWTWFIVIAVKNSPQTVPMESAQLAHP
tara:strand:+ start:5067 stop:5216 length:150 start_codon:yes stop_codon:yes gene_type:complete